MQITPANTSDIPALCDLLGILFSQEADFKPNYEAQSRGLARIIRVQKLGLYLSLVKTTKLLVWLTFSSPYQPHSVTTLHYSKIW
jgi:hypothetical protein